METVLSWDTDPGELRSNYADSMGSEFADSIGSEFADSMGSEFAELLGLGVDLLVEPNFDARIPVAMNPLQSLPPPPPPPPKPLPPPPQPLQALSPARVPLSSFDGIWKRRPSILAISKNKKKGPTFGRATRKPINKIGMIAGRDSDKSHVYSNLDGSVTVLHQRCPEFKRIDVYPKPCLFPDAGNLTVVTRDVVYFGSDHHKRMKNTIIDSASQGLINGGRGFVRIRRCASWAQYSTSGTQYYAPQVCRVLEALRGTYITHLEMIVCIEGSIPGCPAIEVHRFDHTMSGSTLPCLPSALEMVAVAEKAETTQHDLSRRSLFTKRKLVFDRFVTHVK
jgi:hypothetical protein